MLSDVMVDVNQSSYWHCVNAGSCVVFSSDHLLTAHCPPHTVHVHKMAVGLVAWFSSGTACSEQGRRGLHEREETLLLPSCNSSNLTRAQGHEPCSTNMHPSTTCRNTTARMFSSAAYEAYVKGMEIHGVPAGAAIMTYVPLCCVPGYCNGETL